MIICPPGMIAFIKIHMYRCKTLNCPWPGTNVRTIADSPLVGLAVTGTANGTGSRRKAREMATSPKEIIH